MALTEVAAAREERAAGFDKRYLERTVALNMLELCQVRDCGCREAEGRTSSDAHLLVYMLSGDAVVTAAEEQLRLPARHFIRLNPRTGYRIASEGRPHEAARFLCVELKPRPGSNRLFSLFETEAGHRVVADRLGMDELFFSLIGELQRQDNQTRIMLDSILNQIVITAGRIAGGYAGRGGGSSEKAPGRKELVYQVVQYIDRHMDRIEELGQVAAHFGYSYSYLSHAFRAEMGVPLQIYWANRRMMRAMNRLQAGRASITQISEELRYQSIHSFSKAFKKMTGFTPSEYQSLYGAKRGNG
ncbi:helix-turn-helix transcriptional regulator [Paenibacillus nanensis]|nr:AraC family transcriptional regulator [Paenibacillus nanensis]